MKQQPTTLEITTDTPVAEPSTVDTSTVDTSTVDTPTRSVEDLMASFTMKPSVSLPREMRKGLLVLVVALSLTLVLGTAVLLAGGAAFWSRVPATPDPTPSDRETTADTRKPEGGHPNNGNQTPTYPYADGQSGNANLSMPSSVASVNASLITSTYAVVADASTGTVLASKEGDAPMYPASMTKVMTLIVAVERLPHESSLQDTVVISQEVFDTMVAEGSSGIGFEPGETLSVEALLYALMLQSDGIAACELANYIAGSEEAFVALMNQKAASMGLTSTHFENPTGLHHPDHKSTAREIAAIMAYAMNMDLCRTIMTTEHLRVPFLMSNGVQKHYDIYNKLLVHTFTDNPDHDPAGMKLLAGKTGYTPESGSCLVTYAERADGHGYVCVTADTRNVASCIQDYMALYNTYAKS